jgi:S-phase kinase-associated protein 1
MEQTKLSIGTSDGKQFLMDRSDALDIPYIQTKLEENEASEIVLEKVNYEQLEKVIEFIHQCQIKPYKAPLPKPLPSSRIEDVIDNKWYIDFIELPRKELIKLIRTANYLNVERLFELASAKLGSEIKGMTIEELREFFDIKNDFTEDEEETIKNGRINMYNTEKTYENTKE